MLLCELSCYLHRAGPCLFESDQMVGVTPFHAMSTSMKQVVRSRGHTTDERGAVTGSDMDRPASVVQYLGTSLVAYKAAHLGSKYGSTPSFGRMCVRCRGHYAISSSFEITFNFYFCHRVWTHCSRGDGRDAPRSCRKSPKSRHGKSRLEVLHLRWWFWLLWRSFRAHHLRMGLFSETSLTD